MRYGQETDDWRDEEVRSGGGGDGLECHSMKSQRGLEEKGAVANVGTCWYLSLILNEMLLISWNPSACPLGSRV